MRHESNVALAVVATAMGLFSAGCSKDSAAGKPAAIAPMPSQAAPARTAGPAAPASPSLPAPASPSLPAPPPAARQALQRALGVESAAAPGEAEAVPDVPPVKETISGTIVLPAANRSKVTRGETIFLAARRAGGPAGPGSMMAVQKLQAEDFPMKFTISGRDAMIPGIPFEGQMSITVRVDKDGDAMTRLKGDVFGQSKSVKVGTQGVVISLDSVQAEDKTLAMPGAMPGASPGAAPEGTLPAGHP